MLPPVVRQAAAWSAAVICCSPSPRCWSSLVELRAATVPVNWRCCSLLYPAVPWMVSGASAEGWPAGLTCVLQGRGRLRGDRAAGQRAGAQRRRSPSPSSSPAAGRLAGVAPGPTGEKIRHALDNAKGRSLVSTITNGVLSGWAWPPS